MTIFIRILSQRCSSDGHIVVLKIKGIQKEHAIYTKKKSVFSHLMDKFQKVNSQSYHLQFNEIFIF